MKTSRDLTPYAQRGTGFKISLALLVFSMVACLFTSTSAWAQEANATCEVVATVSNTVSSNCPDVLLCQGPVSIVVHGNPGDRGGVRCGTGAVITCVIADDGTSCTQSDPGKDTPQTGALCRVTVQAENKTARAVCSFGLVVP
jgi:hypothetical protein